MKYLRLAFSMLTILPVGNLAESPQSGDSGRAAVWYSLVGLVIGLLVAAGWWLFHLIFPPLVTAGLTLALWIGLTGGLHLDGLADCFDGLFTGETREHRLEIMADSRLGSFGTIALVLYLLLKLAALSTLSTATIPLAIIFSCVFSRWLILMIGWQPQAREGGMAADFSAGLTIRAMASGAVLPIGLLFIGGWPTGLAAVLATLAAFGILTLARNRIGGVTGDVFGMVIEFAELMVLLTYAAL